MGNSLTSDGIKYIISRLVSNAYDATSESRKNKEDEFAAGRKVAYYEMLDILKSELLVREQDLKEYGLDFNLEKNIA